MNISNLENKFLSSMAFLSGCFPIAVIHCVRVTIIPHYNSIDNLQWNIINIFAVGFVILTTLCSILFYISINRRFSLATVHVEVCDLKRKDLFSSGALSCYVLPFLSLSGNDTQSTVSLFLLVLLFLRVFNNNIKFLYTPMIDILGYKILEGKMVDSSTGLTIERPCNLLVKSDQNFYFETSNSVLMEKINETTFCVKLVATS